MKRRIALAATLSAGLAAASIPLVAAADTESDAEAQDDPGAPCASVNEELTERFGDYGDTAGRWTGADSSFSVPVDDETVWLYSDTFMGEVDEDHGRPEDSPFIHNSMIIEEDGELTTITGGTEDEPESLVAPEGADEDERWYWFADGAATPMNGELHVMLLEFEKTGDGVFDFGFVGNAVATFDLDDMSLTEVTEMPESEVQWGSAIYSDPGSDWLYVFGVEDNQSDKYAHLARAQHGSLDGTWEYYDDGEWTEDPSSTSRILEGVANEFSVSRLHGEITLVTSDATEELSSKIVMYTAEDIEGPYTDKTELYDTPETEGDIYTYNAKMHDKLSTADEMVLTYNVNSVEIDDVFEEVDNYRPRYIDVAFGDACDS